MRGLSALIAASLLLEAGCDLVGPIDPKLCFKGECDAGKGGGVGGGGGTAGGGGGAGQSELASDPLDFGGVELNHPSVLMEWRVTNRGSATSGVPVVMSSDRVLTVTNNCADGLAVGASCRIGAVFTPDEAGDQTATVVLATDGVTALTLIARAKGMVRLQIAPNGGTISSYDLRIECGPICSALYDVGTRVFLSATLLDGGAPRFLDWGTPCLSRTMANDRACSFPLTASRTVSPKFETLRNLAFVTSVGINGNFGGPPNADALCNTLALDAGINKTGNDFFAYVSTVGRPAKQLQLNGGLVRMDGTPFVQNQLALLSNKILSPLNLDERGVLVSVDEVWTGTDSNGDATDNCGDWGLAPGGTGKVGRTQGGPGLWVAAGTLPCNQPARLYCLGGASPEFAYPPPKAPKAKAIYFTAGRFIPGVSTVTVDQFCNDNRPIGVAFVTALLATSTRAAWLAPVLNPLAPYYRPDGMFVGYGSEIRDGFVPNGIWVRSDGQGTFADDRVWTGADTPTASGLETCGNWSTTAGDGRTGQINVGGQGTAWFNDPLGSPLNSCNTPMGLGLICIEP